MSRLGPWLVCVILASSALVQWGSDGGSKTGFSTLPILSPVSPELEQAMRKQRGQATPVSPRRATQIVQAIGADEQLGQGAREAVAKQLVNATQSVGGLRTLRDERHGLNVAMMNVGVEIASKLTPAQWSHIHMHRDVRDGLAELDTLRRVRAELQSDQSR
jgi:Spy/CpxP family protein refolding chaperone